MSSNDLVFKRSQKFKFLNEKNIYPILKLCHLILTLKKKKKKECYSVKTNASTHSLQACQSASNRKGYQGHLELQVIESLMGVIRAASPKGQIPLSFHLKRLSQSYLFPFSQLYLLLTPANDNWQNPESKSAKQAEEQSIDFSHR